MNPNFTDQALYEEYEAMFRPEKYQEAWEFLKLSCEYYEMIDDDIDEEPNDERKRKIQALAGCVYNSPYWRKWGHMLYLVDRIIHCQYFDSVMWERHSNEDWKIRDGKALSHAAVNMVFAVIVLEFGQDVLDKFSLKFREHAHKNHLKDIGL